MSFALTDWLAHSARLHTQVIELGLERVRVVWERMHERTTHAFPVITVAGTNGKGSTCAYLEAMLREAGYLVGLYTSPHLLRYNERVRVAGVALSDEALSAAYALVEEVRGNVALTEFEFGTLAAMMAFHQSRVEVAVLEVGLGGRLDAVNVFDNDCAILTAIDLDHQAWLGTTREVIGAEKSGVMRAQRPVICADPNPPQVIAECARGLKSQLWQLGKDFWLEDGGSSLANLPSLCWRVGPQSRAVQLPRLPLSGGFQYHNAAAAWMALELLEEQLPGVTPELKRKGLELTRLDGRFQVVGNAPTLILDVAHNPQAASALACNLRSLPCAGTTWGILGMMGDKDVGGFVAALGPTVAHWWVVDLEGTQRAATAQQLQLWLRAQGVEAEIAGSVGAALQLGQTRAKNADRIVITGSFVTVGQALKTLGVRVG